jgi:DNA-binding NarL/FixJ family response regulator
MLHHLSCTARDGRSLINMARQNRPDVIVMDIAMPSLNGIDATRILQKEGCSAKILFLTMHADLSIAEEAFRAGASGFLLKVCDAEQFVKAIQTVAKGETYITPLLAGDLISSLMIVTGSNLKCLKKKNQIPRRTQDVSHPK